MATGVPGGGCYVPTWPWGVIWWNFKGHVMSFLTGCELTQLPIHILTIGGSTKQKAFLINHTLCIEITTCTDWNAISFLMDGVVGLEQLFFSLDECTILHSMECSHVGFLAYWLGLRKGNGWVAGGNRQIWPEYSRVLLWWCSCPVVLKGARTSFLLDLFLLSSLVPLAWTEQKKL